YCVFLVMLLSAKFRVGELIESPSVRVWQIPLNLALNRPDLWRRSRYTLDIAILRLILLSSHGPGDLGHARAARPSHRQDHREDDHQRDEHDDAHSAASSIWRAERSAMRRSSSGRKWRIRPWIGQAAASPSAQMVWPSTCLVTSSSLSISATSTSPSRIFSMIRHIQPVPSRHGVHWPQLSCL